jgi:REP element-mobilizing transposase RayT
MRQLRVLAQGVWYEVRTRINNREPLFRRYQALAIFTPVFRETELRFVFEVRDLRLEDDRLTFYIKPEDGLELPDIMKWMKQVFAQRFNAADGRTGHIWGDRYWSRIVEGEPEAEGTTEAGTAASGDRPRWRGSVKGDRPRRRGPATGDRPRRPESERDACFSLISPHSPPISPG